MRLPRQWDAGQNVEARHPSAIPFNHRDWTAATVVEQQEFYVRVRFDDDGREATTYHLNVREPGAPDPLREVASESHEGENRQC